MRRDELYDVTNVFHDQILREKPLEGEMKMHNIANLFMLAIAVNDAGETIADAIQNFTDAYKKANNIE